MGKESTDSEYYSDANAYCGAERSASLPSQKTVALESQGVFVWLKTIFPFAFEEDFSEDHKIFWLLWWSVLLRIREQKKYIKLGLPIPEKFEISEAEFVILLILGRGLGKSACLEASSVMRGAILEEGYCLYVCETGDQSEEHIASCRSLIENYESRLVAFYPHMQISDGETLEGVKTKDKADIFITVGGWICRGKGLDAKMRGLRIGKRRPDDLNIDDVDDTTDSIALSISKLKKLASKVLPVRARRHTTIKFGQNLILETGVMNQIYTGKSDALAERTTIGVSNTFVSFEEGRDYETYFDEAEGRYKHKILPSAQTTWLGVSLKDAQRFLNDSGLEIFIAEYQNQFEHQKTGLVFHEYNERRHIITWSDFQKLFGVRYIPAHWQAKGASDIGYSKESISAWAFVATSAANSNLPNCYFLYRGLTFSLKSIDDQAEDIWEEFFPDVENGKLHFEAQQTFENYPELLRLLKTKPRCAPFIQKVEPNLTQNFYPAAAFGEDENLLYVKAAQKTFVSQVTSMQMSHEKSGEQKTLAQKYGLPVAKTKNFGKTSGKAEANHLLRGTYAEPHPFYADEINPETGLYVIGRPYLFLIVDDDQKQIPKDDKGLKIFRQHLSSQRMSAQKMTEQGLTESVPMKYLSDCGDALRMWAADYAIPSATELTPQEKLNKMLPKEVLPQRTETGYSITIGEQMALQANITTAREKLKEEYGEDIFDREDDSPKWYE